MVEQLSVKQWVVGSSPTICTNKCLVNGQVVYRVGTPDWKSEEVRSTRALPTNCCEAAPSVQDTWWRMKQDYWVGIGVSAVLRTRTLGFYAIHKPTRRNPKEKHTNSANGMRAEWKSLSIYFWNIWNKKLYLWEVFYTKDVNPSLFYLIVFNKWRGTQVAKGDPLLRG